jgi:cellulose synthase/poly-beta-1,6-N-acetylglucosamine synthase-like glycosyltransferase
MLALLATGVTVLLAVPAWVLLIEVLLARSAKPRPIIAATQRPRIAILIPAHNEAGGIGATIACIASQLVQLGKPDGDRIVVIADNCNDATASVARASGATVIERSDSMLRGKGYALDFGVRFLAADPPDVVIVIDADCLISDGSLLALANACSASQRPIQARYLMRFPDGSGGPAARVAELALLVKNWVRPQGLARWGLPCPLLGSGMAFPWSIISTVDLASGNIVEDMRLGSDLVALGLGPRFLSSALVYSTFPVALDGQQSQRKRWEHGHLQTLLTQVPRLLVKGVLRADLSIIAYALDLAVPPLALLSMVLSAALALAVLVAAVVGFTSASLFAVAIVLTAILALVLAVFLAWDRFARDVVGIAELRSVPAYALRKIPVYLKFFIARQTAWIRSRRDHE